MKGYFSIGSNGITSSSEDLAYYYVKDMIEGVLLWYSEKQYWVKQDFSEETRHYTSMINPKYTHVGFGGFIQKLLRIRQQWQESFLQNRIWMRQ